MSSTETTVGRQQVEEMLAEIVKDDLDKQTAHSGALDHIAGLFLGLTSATLALAVPNLPAGSLWQALIGGILTGAGAFCALIALVVFRSALTADYDQLRQLFPDQPDKLQEHVNRLRQAAAEAARGINSNKSRCIYASVVLLLLGVVVLALSYLP